MRTQVRAYYVSEDICVGKGRALANTKLGSGGGLQFFIPKSAQDALKPGKILSI